MSEAYLLLVFSLILGRNYLTLKSNNKRSAISFKCRCLCNLCLYSCLCSFWYVCNHIVALDDKQRNRLVFKQLLIYFLWPIVIPIIISFTVSIKLNKQLLVGTQIAATTYTFYGATLGLFLIVYCIYFVATYVGFKRNINQ